ncbi:MAG: hypothetical protein WCF37_02520, partial [Pseudolabrys sp.]
AREEGKLSEKAFAFLACCARSKRARPKCRAFSPEPEYDSESKQEVVSPLPGHLLRPIKGALP